MARRPAAAYPRRCSDHDGPRRGGAAGGGTAARARSMTHTCDCPFHGSVSPPTGPSHNDNNIAIIIFNLIPTASLAVRRLSRFYELSSTDGQSAGLLRRPRRCGTAGQIPSVRWCGARSPLVEARPLRREPQVSSMKVRPRAGPAAQEHRGRALPLGGGEGPAAKARARTGHARRGGLSLHPPPQHTLPWPHPNAHARLARL